MRNLIVLCAVIALGAAYTFYSDFAAPSQGIDKLTVHTAAKPGEKAPDFSFTDMKGQNHSLSDFKDKAIILNFWASWCAPCIIEFPQMLNLAKQTRGKAAFIFISLDDDTDAMNRFLEKLGSAKNAPNIFIGRDAEKKISQELYQTYKLPETYIISPGLFLHEKIIGLPESWDSPAMQQKINNL